ncbi:MAG TPA: MFS transporter, partial [Candidatus Dormibacteraeota bacterium]
MFGRSAAGRAEEAATIRWLLAGQLLMFCGIAAIFPVAPLYVEAHGGGAVAAALFIAGALVANAVVQIPAGRLVDRIGRRPFLLGGRIVFAILSLAIFFLDFAPLWVLAILRTAMGAASGAYIPALLATITDLSPPTRRAERFSQLQAAELVGLLVGPLIGGLIALWNPSGIFLVA